MAWGLGGDKLEGAQEAALGSLCLLGKQMLSPPLRCGLQPWRVGGALTPEQDSVGGTPVLPPVTLSEALNLTDPSFPVYKVGRIVGHKKIVRRIK